MTERWLNEHNRLLLAAALLHEQNHQWWRLRWVPYAWRLSCVNESWFEIYSHRAISETFSCSSLCRMNRATFDTVNVVNTQGPRIVRGNSQFRACLQYIKHMWPTHFCQRKKGYAFCQRVSPCYSIFLLWCFIMANKARFKHTYICLFHVPKGLFSEIYSVQHTIKYNKINSMWIKI